jgi:enamine deaminase RidA (YjgF/YER057c/UK114 family)|tara:strand:- start:31 stop:549 length:519 start_codon:yes stop_codon:yes gene_type:complete
MAADQGISIFDGLNWEVFLDTKEKIMNKFVSFLFLVTVLGYCAMAGAKTTYFKSEVAGQDLPFSDAALVGNTLYISGKGGVLPGTRTVPEDPTEEARLLMEDFKTTLERVDMTMDDLVYVTVYCTDLSLYSDFNEVYRSYFSKDFPPRAFVGSGPLLFGLRFEMQGIAVRQD